LDAEVYPRQLNVLTAQDVEVFGAQRDWNNGELQFNEKSRKAYFGRREDDSWKFLIDHPMECEPILEG